jgi:hypothetical protein
MNLMNINYYTLLTFIYISVPDVSDYPYLVPCPFSCRITNLFITESLCGKQERIEHHQNPS